MSRSSRASLSARTPSVARSIGGITRRIGRRAAALTVAAHACIGAAATAQGSRRVELSPADAAIAAGRLDVAEALLFADSRRTPREPSARGALGAFLAARGKLLVGATLLEEALEFGADSAMVEARLFEIYRWEGRYDRAAGQRSARVAPELREAMRRAAVATTGGAPSATVQMLPNEALGLGRITLALGGERFEADIQPLAPGIALPSSMAMFAAVEPVGAHGDTTFAVAQSVAIGGVTIGPVPVMLVPSLRTARLGLDVLALLEPTFDYGARTLTVRSEPGDVPGRALPILLTFPGVSLVPREGQGPVGLHTAAGRAALRGTRWTLRVSAGAIVVAR